MIKTTKKNLLSLVVAATAVGGTTFAEACSRILWETENHGVFVSRTMDWLEDTHASIEVRPSGLSYRGTDGENALTWTAKYASIGSTLYGIGFIDGFNEVGFSANALFLDEESAGELNESKEQLLNARMVAYLIDNFATVEEALENVKKIQMQTFTHGDMAMTGHYSIQDKSGDSAILEFIEGEWNIYHGKEYTVMTNSPSYDQHLANWEEAKPKTQADYRGTFELPGNVISPQRFTWNTYMAGQLAEPSSYTNGLAKIDSVTFKVPLDAANREVGGVMAGYATQYILTYNLDKQIMNVRYQYGDAYTHYSVDLNELNDGKIYSVPSNRPDLFGNVTDQLTEATSVMAPYTLN